jgi:hypothetical protein
VSFGTPESLLRQAEGSVWQIVVASEQFEQLRRNLKVSSAVRRPDGVHARIVALENPGYDAVAVEPTLEDAFLSTMNTARAA